MGLLQLRDQLLGQIVFRLRPQYSAADAAVLLNGRREADQLVHVGLDTTLDGLGEFDFFI